LAISWAWARHCASFVRRRVDRGDVIDDSTAVERSFHVYDEADCGVDERTSVFDGPADCC
jgi:hypothetical protein